MVPQSLMTGLEMVETKYKKMLTGGRHTNNKQLFRHTCIIPTMLKTAVRLTCKKIATVPFCKPNMFIGTMGTLRSSGFAVAKLPFSLRIDAILRSLPSRLLRFWSLNDFKPSKKLPSNIQQFSVVDPQDSEGPAPAPCRRSRSFIVWILWTWENSLIQMCPSLLPYCNVLHCRKTLLGRDGMDRYWWRTSWSLFHRSDNAFLPQAHEKWGFKGGHFLYW